MIGTAMLDHPSEAANPISRVTLDAVAVRYGTMWENLVSLTAVRADGMPGIITERTAPDRARSSSWRLSTARRPG